MFLSIRTLGFGERGFEKQTRVFKILGRALGSNGRDDVEKAVCKLAFLVPRMLLKNNNTKTYHNPMGES